MTVFSNLSLCSSDPCSSPEPGQAPHHDGTKKSPSFLGCSWRRRKMTKKMKKQERRHHHNHHQEPIIVDSPISTDFALKEWFAKSPSIENKRIICSDNNNNNNSVSFSSGQSSLEDLLNSREFQTSSSMETEEEEETSSSRELSLSLEKLMMIREKKKVEVVEVGLYSFSKTNSRERKVSFRLPEASDIIILNSPERR